jgi:hypothetical protein
MYSFLIIRKRTGLGYKDSCCLVVSAGEANTLGEIWAFAGTTARMATEAKIVATKIVIPFLLRF